MRKILFIIILSWFSSIVAQTKRFYYEIVFKPNVDKLIVKKDFLVLDIDNDKTTCYSNEYLVVDSLNSTKKGNFKFGYPKFAPIVIRNREAESFLFINNLSMYTYRFTKEIKLNWILHQESKKLGAYHVQKATVDYGGRKWVAWFTPEIPFPYGPYIFHGLPGMILEVYDTEDDYHFTFFQNKNIDTSLDWLKKFERYLGIEQLNIKSSDWQKVQLNYYNNPIPEYKRGKAKRVKDDGTDYNATDYRDWEKRIRSYIRNNSNAIEKDEIPNYPAE